VNADRRATPIHFSRRYLLEKESSRLAWLVLRYGFEQASLLAAVLRE